MAEIRFTEGTRADPENNDLKKALETLFNDEKINTIMVNVAQKILPEGQFPPKVYGMIALSISPFIGEEAIDHFNLCDGVFSVLRKAREFQETEGATLLLSDTDIKGLENVTTKILAETRKYPCPLGESILDKAAERDIRQLGRNK